ncbi:MAG: hypothetical protein ACI8ZF_000042 [Candidatus Midichloriaceae bacterium]|jgi:hypothetical protein
MKKFFILTLLISLFMFSGCTQNTKSFFGLNKDSPDEFTIIPNKPLVIPPTFDLPTPEYDHETKTKKIQKDTNSKSNERFLKNFNDKVSIKKSEKKIKDDDQNDILNPFES